MLIKQREHKIQPVYTVLKKKVKNFTHSVSPNESPNVLEIYLKSTEIFLSGTSIFNFQLSSTSTRK